MFHKISKRHPQAALSSAASEHRRLVSLLGHARAVALELEEIATELYCHALPGGSCGFSANITINEKMLASLFRDCGDLKTRRLFAGSHAAILYYIESMVDGRRLDTAIAQLQKARGRIESTRDVEAALPSTGLKMLPLVDEASGQVLQGYALLLIDGLAFGTLLEVADYAKRGVEEAKRESILRGPYDAFTETLGDNLALIRRRTSDTNVKVRFFSVGERSKTRTALVYVENLAKAALVGEVSRRLRNISTDKLLSGGNLEELLSDTPWSPFPYLQGTERPDKTVAALYEGRVVIIVDNTPWVLLAPCTYNTLMQSPDDYTLPSVIASAIRFTRHLSVLAAIFLPGFYIAIVSFQTGILPSSLALTIAELRARAPFPGFLEAFVMEAILEIFQEAIARLPAKLVVAASVVGGFVIGSTVVEAGIINPFLVVIIATTAIASYSIPSYPLSLSLRWLRVPVMLLSATFGLYGLMIATLFILTHMSGLKNFGESFLGEMWDVSMLQSWKDSLVRLPARLLRVRPKVFGAEDRIRGGGTGD